LAFSYMLYALSERRLAISYRYHFRIGRFR
jgi:hypothetical protein